MNVNRIARVIVPVLVLIAVVYIFASSNARLRMGDTPETIGYTQFLQDIDLGQVSDGNIDKDNFNGHLTKGNMPFTVYLGPDNSFLRQDLVERLSKGGVTKFQFTPPLISDGLSAILSMVLLPAMVLFFFWMFFLRSAQNGGNQAMSFGRSRAKRLNENVPKVTFDDVAGVSTLR